MKLFKSPLFLVFFIILAAGLVGWQLTLRAPDASAEETAGESSARIGGNFTLTDPQGNTVTQQALEGTYSLIFFGFTHCPDMCPAGLSTITNALESMPEAVATQVKPVFISVDPARDTPERMGEYAANFHPRLLALTGSAEAVAQAANAFKVFYQNAGVPADAEGNYMVNHSGYIYFMGPDGHYIKHFAHNADPEKLSAMVSKTIAP